MDDSTKPIVFAGLTQQLHAAWQQGQTVCIALSGGCDSVVLLHACAVACAQTNPSHSTPLVALHVNHGLSTHADQWTTHCEQLCTQLNVPLRITHIEGLAHSSQRKRRGTEEAARDARYTALTAMATQAKASMVLLAHHRDDLVETFLLQLLRGASLRGATSMRARTQRAGMTYVRPLLDVDRNQIEQYAAQHQLQWVEDDSNTDPRYARNALRHQIMPAVAQLFPSYRTTLSRAIEHATQTNEVVQQLTQADLAQCVHQHPQLGIALDLSRLVHLEPYRQALVLRAWIESLQLRIPSQARLAQMLEQALRSRPDASVQFTHEYQRFARYRNWLVQLGSAPPPTMTAQTIALHWQGQERLPLVDTDQERLGDFVFTPASDTLLGVPTKQLMQASLDGQLRVRARSGAEQLKLHPARPLRSLKKLYQEAGIAAWQRSALPLLWMGDQLIFAAGLGMDVRACSQQQERVLIHFEPAHQTK